MKITSEQLKQIVPTVSDKIVETVTKAINEHAEKYEINTPRRMAMFLANVGHESGAFRYVREVWRPTAAQKGYEGRKDLGNIQAGDGKKFMGRGYMQLTGRDVYREFSRYAFGDDRLLVTPELVEAPNIAMESAMWFWKVYKNLNVYVDKPDTWKTYRTKDVKKKFPMGPFEYVCYRINGTHPANGLAERKTYYNNAIKVLVV